VETFGACCEKLLEIFFQELALYTILGNLIYEDCHRFLWVLKYTMKNLCITYRFWIPEEQTEQDQYDFKHMT